VKLPEGSPRRRVVFGWLVGMTCYGPSGVAVGIDRANVTIMASERFSCVAIRLTAKISITCRWENGDAL